MTSAVTKTFVVFSDDWGVHPSSSQHIFSHIAKKHRVEWVNTVGMRRPRLEIADIRKGFRKLAGMIRRGVAAEADVSAEKANVNVHQPLMIPFNDIGFVRRFNERSVRKTLRAIERDLHGELPCVVTTVPNACDYVDAIPSNKVVYYCVDDFSEWPGLDKDLVLEMEAQLIEKSQSFLATSPQLFNRLSLSGKPTAMLSHGVDIDLFAMVADREHAVLADIPTPRVGYFGLFDARSDQELIAEVARRLPYVSFVVAGRVETTVDALSRLANVHFVGLLSYTDLPQLVKGLDVLFLPYIVNALSDALSPLKFKEYLATGNPVLSTPIAAAAEFDDCIAIASSAEDWQRELEAMLTTPQAGRKEDMLQRLAGESWAEKSTQFLRHCAD